MSEVRKIQIQDGKGNVYHPQTVSEQVLGLDNRLEGLAKETYVDEKIAAIPEVDLTDIENNISTLEENKADKTDVDSKLSLKADKADMDSKLSLKADKTELDNKADKAELTPINKEIDNLKSSGVESNRIMVEALNSKGVQASIKQTIRENASKINDISVGDYSIGDICKRVEEVWEMTGTHDTPQPVWEHHSWYTSCSLSDVDENNFLYFQGSDAFKEFIFKMAPTNAIMWRYKTYQCQNLRVGEGGSVYFSHGHDLVCISKLDTQGNLEWTTVLWNDESDTYPRVTLGIFSDGSFLAGSEKATLKKFSNTGQEEWSRRVAIDDGGIKMTKIAIGPEDSAYLLGMKYSEYLALKVSPSGTILWTVGDEDDRIENIAADDEGYLYLVRSNRVTKVSPDNQEQWSKVTKKQATSLYTRGNEVHFIADQVMYKLSSDGKVLRSTPVEYSSAMPDYLGAVYRSGEGASIIREQIDKMDFRGYKILE